MAWASPRSGARTEVEERDMIYDGMAGVERYGGLYRGFDVLIDWLGKNDYRALEAGRHEILGDRVFALAQDATTRRRGDAHYEAHRRYMDLQVDVEGHEAFLVTPGATEPLSPYDEGVDKQYLDVAVGNDDEFGGELGHGRFVLFVVGEPHMPNLAPAGMESGPIRKVCFKILADEFWD